ncbi:MAG: diguanylate cyclase, partial [Sphingobacteriales bacterium]
MVVLKLWLLLLLGTLGGCTAEDSQFSARNGVMDITGVALDQGVIVKLDGQWEFYWQQLYSPAQFAKAQLAPPAYIEVPVFWNAQKINGRKLPWNGFATYRLRVKTAVAQGRLALAIPDPNSAIKVWVNGRLVAQSGMPGANKAAER